MAKLINLETKEVRSVTLNIGDEKIPAKLFARNLLPSNLTVLQDAYSTAQEYGNQEKILLRDIKVLNKRFEEQLLSEKYTADETQKTSGEIQAKERELESVQSKLQEVIDTIEDWNLATVADIDLIEPREGLTDAELEELAALEADGKLEMDSPLVAKVKFSKETMRKLTDDVRSKGLISMAPVLFYKAIMDAASIKKTKSSGSQGR